MQKITIKCFSTAFLEIYDINNKLISKGYTNFLGNYSFNALLGNTYRVIINTSQIRKIIVIYAESNLKTVNIYLNNKKRHIINFFLKESSAYLPIEKGTIILWQK